MMGRKILSVEEKKRFETFGFLGFPGLLEDRIDRITEEFESVWESRGGGHYDAPHIEEERSCIVPFMGQTEYLCTLLDDPRIHGILTSLLGDDFNYMGSDGNYYVGDTGWHSDGWHASGITHVKIALYLDPLTRDTGCLRVIPGSHKTDGVYAQAVQEQIGASYENWGVHGKDVPALALETNPGDLVLFNHNCKHAAFGGSTRRRMFTINSCQRYPEEMLPDLRDYIGGALRFWIDRIHSDIMRDTASPERMVYLEQVTANDGHLAELSAQKRREMSEPSRG